MSSRSSPGAGIVYPDLARLFEDTGAGDMAEYLAGRDHVLSVFATSDIDAALDVQARAMYDRFGFWFSDCPADGAPGKAWRADVGGRIGAASAVLVIMGGGITGNRSVKWVVGEARARPRPVVGVSVAGGPAEPPGFMEGIPVVEWDTKRVAGMIGSRAGAP